MTKLPAALEALMPEPVKAFRDKGTFTLEEKFFTADQMREAMLAAHISALEDAYNAMFDLKGDKVTRFDAQTAIRKLKDAAAIRSGGEAGS